MVEHLPFKEVVPGSSPGRLTLRLCSGQAFLLCDNIYLMSDDFEMPEPFAPVMGEQETIDKSSKFRNFKFKPQYLVFLFILALLPVSVWAVKYVTSFKNKAAENLSVNDTLANNELLFTKSVNDKFLGDISGTKEEQFQKVSGLYGPIFDSRLTAGYFDKMGGYREFCVLASINAVSRGASMSVDDPYFRYFVSRWNSAQFRDLYPQSYKDIYFFLQPYTAYECMLSANLMRDELKQIPGKVNSSITLLDEILDDLSYAGRSMYDKYFISPERAVEIYGANAMVNYGDTQAEESGATAVFFHAASKLLPETGYGAINNTERTNWYDLAKAVIAWSYTKCDGSCSFRERYPDNTNPMPANSNLWLVHNHQIENNPDYTLALPTFYGEMAMIYNQFGNNIFPDPVTGKTSELPQDIFTPAMKTAANSMASDIYKTLSPDFSFQGPFNIVSGDKTILATYNFENARYTMIDSGKPLGISSSIPVNNIANISGFVLADAGGNPTKTLKMYVENENHRWHYTCDLSPNGICKAEYQYEDLKKESWDAIKDSATIWQPQPPTGGSGQSAIDAASYFYNPLAQGQLKAYFYKGDRGWHYICENGTCTAQYTKSLSGFWPNGNREVAGWVTNPPPESDVDTVSQFVIPNSTVVKTYLTKGNRIWSYVVDQTKSTDDEKYKAAYTDTLTNFLTRYFNISGVNQIDSLVQYYLTDSATLQTLIFSGDKVWKYDCTGYSANDPMDNGVTCASVITPDYIGKRNDKMVPIYIGNLADYFWKIYYQFKWPQFNLNDPMKQRVGVTDWGRDATFQNLSFAGFYILNPEIMIHLDKYNALQAEELKRNRDKGITPFPINFENGAWNYNDFAGAVVGGDRLMDGFRQAGQDFDTNIEFLFQKYKPYRQWSLNLLAAGVHLKAYLALTSNKGLITEFSKNPDNILSTPKPVLPLVPTPVSTPIAPVVTNIPNCYLLTGPTTITLGQSAAYSASFFSAKGNLKGEIVAGQNSSSDWVWIPGGKLISGTRGDLSYTWTPTKTGTYDLFCRAWYGGTAECRGDNRYVDQPPRYLCSGPNPMLTVTVVSPTPVPTAASQVRNKHWFDLFSKVFRNNK